MDIPVVTEKRVRLPLRIRFFCSARQRSYLLLLHTLSAVAVFLSPLPWALFLLPVLLYSLVKAWRQAAVLPIQAVRLGWKGRFVCQLADGQWRSPRLLPSSRVWSWLVVLHLAGEDCPAFVVVYPDSCREDDFRRLRIWMQGRIGRPTRRGPEDAAASEA